VSNRKWSKGEWRGAFQGKGEVNYDSSNCWKCLLKKVTAIFWGGSREGERGRGKGEGGRGKGISGMDSLNGFLGMDSLDGFLKLTHRIDPD
jgi:hypothetical protein